MALVQARLENLRSLNESGISGTYAAVGTPLANPCKLVCFTNNTNGDMIFSTDNTIVEGQLFVKAGSFKLFDLSANEDIVFKKGTQFYVKESTAATSGDVYIETIYGYGG